MRRLSADLGDDDINWGAARLGHGKAFDLGEPAHQFPPIQVRRQWGNLEGRTILIEGVPLQNIQSQLSRLPLQSSLSVKHPLVASKTLSLPKTPLAQTKAKPIKMAATPPPAKGYVLDYIQINANETNFTFAGDTTYYISGEYDLLGTTTIEGGTVIKFGGSGQIDIDLNGTVNRQTAPYRSGVFTSVNDNSLGQPISGSSGTPACIDDTGFYLNINTTNAVFHDLRFNYACCAIFHNYPTVPAEIDVWDSQFGREDVAVYSYNIGLHNVLIGKSGLLGDNVVYAEGPSMVGENVTSANGTFGNYFIEADCNPGTASIDLTNCFITSQQFVADYAGAIVYNTNTTIWLPSPTTPVYQIIGGASYYLTNNSPWHNAGTPNITPSLLADLAAKTTYPPLVYSNVTFSIPTNFSPQASRDNAGNPDIGYHYDPLDYVFGGVSAYSNLTFTAGTAVGWFNGGSGEPYGVALQGTAQATFTGTATAPCILARNNMVQESVNGYWNAQSYLGGFLGLGGNYTTATAPTLNLTFTHCYARSPDGSFFRDSGDGTLLVTKANNSEFYDGQAAGYLMYFYFTNCLSDRSILGANCTCSPVVTMRNCTFFGGTLSAERSGTTWPVVIENCAFDHTDFTYLDNPVPGNTNVTWCNFNTFLTGDSLPVGQGSHYWTTNSYNWQTSWFGNYYLPTNSTLIAMGSTTADQVGLYHFTTQTNQVPETNSIVDIGYHYVATDAYGNPLDTNGDGIPDYLEDANGDGLFDTGDLGDWQISPYGLGAANGLQVFTPLK